MKTLAEEVFDIELYSIDEAFLHISADDYTAYGRHLKALVQQRTGIPVSVGIGTTKTLAKVANAIVKKKEEYKGVFDITDHPALDELLAQFPSGELWGIGRRYEKLLLSAGLSTARDLKYASDEWIRKKMSRTGLQMVFELRGVQCKNLIDTVNPKKSITVSRSFGRVVSQREQLQQAVGFYTVRAAEKLRREGCLASTITVFVATSYHDRYTRYYNSSTALSVATAYTPIFYMQ